MNNPERRLRVAIYIRVSTIDQAREGYSLPAQKKALISWCESLRYDVIHVYEDAGISGKNINHRPDMVSLLSDADNGSFDLVLVWALSRLTRSVSDLYLIWDRLQKHNIDIRSYTEPFDTSTPIGRAMMGIVGVFAQMERELTAERVRAAMAERAVQGKRTCSEVLGYDLDGSDSFRINEAEAERVRYIFDQYLRHHNYSTVARLCEMKGYRGKRGRVFKAEHIKTILSRPVYAGYNSYHGQIYKGDFDPIIPVKTWNKVQKSMPGKVKMQIKE